MSRRRAPGRRTGGAAIAAGLVLVLAAVYGVPVARHAARAADPLVFNDDVRQQIVPFFRAADGRPGDVVTEYYLACMPVGYRALYGTAALAVDPAVLSKALPYALLLALLAAVALAGHGLGGCASAALSAAVVLAGDTFLERMVGGLPRAFGYPLLALAAAALVAGRAGWLAAVVVVAAALYPPAALMAGLALGVVLLAPPARDRGTAASWTARRRLLVLASTAGIALAVHLPTAVACGRFGPALAPTDAAAYPEIGPGGRYGPEDRAPFPGFGAQALAAVARMFPGAPPTAGDRAPAARTRPYRATAGLAVLVAALAWAAWSGAAGRRLLALGAGAVAGHALARLLAPHLFLPSRYVTYPVPVLVAVAVPAAAMAVGTLAARWLPGAGNRGPGTARGPAAGPALGAALGAGLLALAGGRVSAHAGWSMQVSPATAIYRAVAALPADALVGGWPAGPVDSVPYLARRRALLGFETHQAFHRAYADEMRRRAGALFAAYFATTWAPVLRLRDEFGVTHLLVDRDHLSGLSPPRYFAPFDEAIAAAWARGRRDGFVLARPPPTAVRFTERALVLLDLRALP